MRQNEAEESAAKLPIGQITFLNLLLQYCLHRTNLIDRNAIPGSPMLGSPLRTTLGNDAQISGSEIDVSPSFCSPLSDES